ncbi:MAG: hypothetical protein WD512_18405 [Candidatus Paceibacterota bacterium]
MKLPSLALLMFVLIFGCTSQTEKTIPHTESDVLNEFVASAPVQYLSLDDTPIQYIHLNDDNIIFSTKNEYLNQEVIVSRISDFIYFNERFYIYDNFQFSVFQIQKNGTISGPFTSKGRGPGEHLVVTSLNNNSRYIYLTDLNNARINVYNEDMTYVHEIGSIKGFFKTQYIDLNDKIMLFSNPNNAGFMPNSPDEGLIVVSPIEKYEETITTILPRIIPNGYQPQVYNSPNFSVNRKNEIAASYAPLPWVFLFDEKYSLKLTLVLEYSLFKEMNIPKMDFFKPKGNEGYGGAMPFRQFTLLDNGDLFISILNELIHISFDKNQQKYIVKARYQFIMDSHNYSLWVSNIYRSNDGTEFYAGNWDYLFRFSLLK